MDTPPDASTSLSHDSCLETSVDSECASNRLKRPRDDSAASGDCSSPSSNQASEDFSHLDLDTETNNRRSFLFKLEELNLVSTDPKVTCSLTPLLPFPTAALCLCPYLPVPAHCPPPSTLPVRVAESSGV